MSSRSSRTDAEFFDALCAAMTKHGLWGNANVQLHPADRSRLHQEQFNGRVRQQGGVPSMLGQVGGSTLLNQKRGDFNVCVVLWDGKTVKRGYVGIEVGTKSLKIVRLFAPVPRPKKPKIERVSRFDRDFEV